MNGTNFNRGKKAPAIPSGGLTSVGKRPVNDIAKLDTLKSIKPLKDPMAPIKPVKPTGAGSATNRVTDALKGAIKPTKRK